jgi:Peptidase M15
VTRWTYRHHRGVSPSQAPSDERPGWQSLRPDADPSVMTTLSITEANGILRDLGWRPATIGSTALHDFQVGWALGSPLKVDNVLGPITSAALVRSRDRHRARQGDASPHFSFSEFRCKCPGYVGCRSIWVRHDLLESLEGLRNASYRSGLSIASGCRCVRHNREVGGASQSQHLYGSAADVPYASSWRSVAALRLFGGIGYSRSTGLVRHVDRRDISGVNPTRGSRKAPTTWVYTR